MLISNVVQGTYFDDKDVAGDYCFYSQHTEHTKINREVKKCTRLLHSVFLALRKSDFFDPN